MNVPCNPQDLDPANASTLMTTVVADETAHFTTHGWYNRAPSQSEGVSEDSDENTEGTREICDVSGCRDCSDAKCSSEGDDCLTVGAEPKTCLDGFVPLDMYDLFHTYTCCSTDSRAFEMGAGQGSQDHDPDQ